MNNQVLVEQQYDLFLKSISNYRSIYGDHSIVNYLTQFRARITSQITKQLHLIQHHNLQGGSMLSLGGWPGIAPIILNQLTGIRITILDHPALMDSMADFYEQHHLKHSAYDFSETEKAPLPITGTFDLIECCQCIEHWNFSPVPLFKQLFKTLLSPKGYLFLTVPNSISLYRRLSVLVGQTPYPSIQSFLDTDEKKPGAEVSPHWREYTRTDVTKLIKYCGGVCTEISTASYAITTKNSLSHRLYSLVSKLRPNWKENIETIAQSTL